MKNENWGKEILEGLKNKVNEIKEDASRDLDIMFSDTKEVMAIWKWTKRLSLIGIGVLITSTVTVTTGEYNTMKKELTQKISNREEDLQKFHKDIFFYLSGLERFLLICFWHNPEVLFPRYPLQ